MAAIRARAESGHAVDHRDRLLVRLQARVDEMAETTARAIAEEVSEFGPIRDGLLYDELLTFATNGIGLSVRSMRRRTLPTAAETEFIRARAARRARELVPLAAMLHAFLIAHRTLGRAIAEEAGSDPDALKAALETFTAAFETMMHTTTHMAVAYLETVQGELADLERQRGELIDSLLAEGAPRPELARRAAGLGLPVDQRLVVVVARATDPTGGDPSVETLRAGAEAVARSGDRSPMKPFVVIRGNEIVAILRSTDTPSTVTRIGQAAKLLDQARRIRLTAGLGPEFTGLAGLRGSYEHANRALRHATAKRPVVRGPEDVSLFDELTVSAADSVVDVVPRALTDILDDPIVRGTIECFVQANMNVALAATALHVHPNTLRYRLERISERTGRDPRKLPDLLEFIAAARVIDAARPR